MIVIVSELVDVNGSGSSQGMSATDGIAQIATAVFDQLGYQFDYLIEHYPPHGVLLDLARSTTPKREVQEQFHLVTLQWDDARKQYHLDQLNHEWAWKKISRAMAEQIIGEKYQVHPTPKPPDA
jgi:hypothetical protein